MKKWIIFDAMGVIFPVGDDVKELLIPFIQERNKVITQEEIEKLYRNASLGGITSEEFWNKAGVCETGDEHAICNTYLDACLVMDKDFINTARCLKKDYNLAILSNDVGEWSAYLRKKFEMDDVIEFSVISGNVNCRKPDKAIYQIALNRTKARATDCVFIDDQDKNLRPAMDLGMNVIRFSGNGDTGLGGVAVISSFLELEKTLRSVWNE